MYKSKLLLLVFIFLAVWWGFINLAKLARGESIPWGNIVLMTIGLVGEVAYFL